MRTTRARTLVAATLPLVFHGAAAAAPNLYLVSQHSNEIREFTLDGRHVASFDVPKGTPADYGWLHDAVVDHRGRLHVFGGNEEAYLNTREPGQTSFRTRTVPGWRIGSGLTYSGIAAFGDSVFTIDQGGDDDVPNGLLRFDLAADTASRFAVGTEYRELNLGLDGLLYALEYYGGEIHVFDPTTQSRLRVIPLGPTPSPNFDRHDALAVDANGHLYVGTLAGYVQHLAPDGSLVEAVQAETSAILDIDLLPDGTMVFTSLDNVFFVTNTSLDEVRRFPAGPGHPIGFMVGFAEPVPVVPEPTGLIVLAAAALLLRRSSRG